jgi:hypothetical protein
VHFLSCEEDPDSLAHLIDFWVGAGAPAWARARLARIAAVSSEALAVGETYNLAGWLTDIVRADAVSPPVSPPWVLRGVGAAGVPLGAPECAAPPNTMLHPHPPTWTLAGGARWPRGAVRMDNRPGSFAHSFEFCVWCCVCVSIPMTLPSRIHPPPSNLVPLVPGLAGSPAHDLLPGFDLARSVRGVVVKTQSDRWVASTVVVAGVCCN